VKIWLVEDDGFKRDKLRAVLRELFPESDIEEARSAKSAFNLLGNGLPNLVVLDMSLPTFDIGPTEPGGRPQGFGGVEVLREMERRDITAPVVVVTQYAFFGEERVNLGELTRQLREEHGERFVELVYYESASEEWKVSFQDAIRRAVSSSGGS
jgi:CheY-like chemotaxis protein